MRIVLLKREICVLMCQKGDEKKERKKKKKDKERSRERAQYHSSRATQRVILYMTGERGPYRKQEGYTPRNACYPLGHSISRVSVIHTSEIHNRALKFIFFSSFSTIYGEFFFKN